VREAVPWTPRAGCTAAEPTAPSPGVCCGLADYFGVDPTLIRVIFVVLNVLGGAGIVLYLLLWIIVPNEPEGHA
jgi:phage shock protein PspC (stress-responsive transcriptional regulator)